MTFHFWGQWKKSSKTDKKENIKKPMQNEK